MADDEFVNSVLEFCYYTKVRQLDNNGDSRGLYTQVLGGIENKFNINSSNNKSNEYNEYKYFYTRETITDRISKIAKYSEDGSIFFESDKPKLFINLKSFVDGFANNEDKRKFLDEKVKDCRVTESSLIALLLWFDSKSKIKHYSLKKKDRKISFTLECLIKDDGQKVCDIEEKQKVCDIEEEEYCYDTWLEDNISECTDWRFFYRSLAIISKDKAGDVKIADMINTYLVHINSDKKIEDDWSVESLFRLFNTEGQSIRERYRIASYLKVLFDIDYSLPSRWSFVPTFSKDNESKYAATEKYFYYCSNDALVKKLCHKLFDNNYKRNILEDIKNDVTFYFEEYSDGYNTDWKSCFDENNNDDSEYDLEAVLIPGKSLKRDICLGQKYKLADDGYDAVLIYDYIKLNDGEVCNHVHGSKTVRVVKL